MGLFSWPAASSSSSLPIPPPPSPALLPETTPAAPSTNPSSSLPPPRKRRKRRDQIPSNAPTYIFSAAGIAFTVGLLISVRQVRKLKISAAELSRKAALAEVNALPGSSLVLEGAAEVPKVKRVGTSSILSPGGGKKAGVLSIPISKTAWALTPPPTFAPPPKLIKVDAPPSIPSPILPPPPPISSPLPPTNSSPSPPKPVVSSLVDAPAPSSSRSSPAPLFPPSKTRLVPSTALPSTTPGTSSPSPPSSLLGLLKAGRAPDPDEEEPPAPPSDPKVILYGFGALGLATVIALTVVALPAAAFCWWLGVEKPSQFRPLLELKLPHLVPSLPPSLVRRTSSNEPNPSPVPSQLHWAKEEDWEEEDDGEEGDEEFLGDATWGDWWARLKEEFEEDRRIEEERKRRSVIEELGTKEV
ncbi:hypothetical protein BDY24DRAFT_392528 [Mrakia frigida]|uniref:uncharacterized protein n=1 Tax=Mrakia frigida TaxID=29902 RepID=UPI003FCC1B63